MKFIHLADLHLGKRVNQFSMIDDQAYIMRQILDCIQTQQPDAVFIAGDVYDRTIPPIEAVELLGDFLAALSAHNIPTFVISGNHDSPERLAFGHQVLQGGHIYISPVYDGHIAPITLTDNHGPVDIYLLPFIKPTHVRRFFPDDPTDSYTDAMATAIAHMPINPQHRNVLLTHQFVTGASRCDSEDVSVGGSDNVDASVFAPFDYVALGHLHGAQSVTSPHIRYSGTPLKYSFSEAKHEKSITVVDLSDTLTITTLPLTPLRDMLEIRGTYLEVSAQGFYQTFDAQSYLHITLTDEQDVPDAMGRLRSIYPNLMRLDYDNLRTRSGSAMPTAQAVEDLNPLSLFSNLYQQQNGADLSGQQRAYLDTVISAIWEEQL